jgi:ABC-2 type transport system ATP-binding protein
VSSLLIAESLTKVFRRRAGRGGDLCAVDGLGFTAERGDILGFLGPNGAGKSTTIRMLLGLIHPTAGRVCIAGHDVETDRLRALSSVGAFVEAPSFYPYLTGRRNLEIFAGLSGGVSGGEIERVLRLVGLHGRENEPVQVYSHGMRQRLGIAACLLPRPELLVLDEPMDGLDPHGIRETSALIRHLARDEGLTIVLSSHMLSEVETVCARIVLLDRGRLILDGRIAELRDRFRRVRITVDRPAEAAALLHARFNLIATAGAAVDVELDGTDAAAVNAALVQAGFAVSGVAPEGDWLERLFLERTESLESARAAKPAGDAQ